MKRFLLVILFVSCTTLAYAQRATQDVIHLKNGSIIKGYILQSPEGTIKIQTRDGCIFVYDSNDVTSKSKEQVAKNVIGKKILDYPKHSFGIRAGGFYSITKDGFYIENVTHADGSYNYSRDLRMDGVGFYIGGVYEISLTKTNRWFFQTGIDFQYIRTLQKSTAADESWFSSDSWDFKNVTGNTIFMEIPTMFSCKFPIKKGISIYPSFGLTHTIGLWGKMSGENKNDDDITDFTSFSYSSFAEDHTYYSGGSDQSHITPYSRYRMNLRGEVNFAIKKVVVGVFATISVVDSNGDYFCASNNGGSANIGLTVGYNF